MSAISKIEWTDRTWNPVRGCSIVSPGCVNCYAMKFAHRFDGPGGPYEGLTKATSAGPQWTGKVQLVESALIEPLSWRKPARVFVNSMSDLFHESVPDAFLDQVFAMMAVTPQHTYQVLTKRPERMCAYLTALPGRNFNAAFIEPTVSYRLPLPNVWLGVSCEDQQRADERIPLLLETPAAVRFVSAEPLLGPIDFGRWLSGDPEKHRGLRVPGRNDGRLTDRRGRQDLASCESSVLALEQQDGRSSLQKATGRTRTDIPNCAGDDRWAARDRHGSSVGVPALSWADSVEADGQSRERNQVGQQARQSQSGDGLTTGNSRKDCAREVSAGRRTEQSREVNSRARRGDSEETLGRGVIEIDRDRLQCERQNCVEDRSRTTLDWVICGGESGPKARPCDVEWIRSIVGQCQVSGVPVFVKQLGANPEWPQGCGDCDPCIDGLRCYQQYNVRMELRDRKGGDPAEWPNDMRVREFPRECDALAALKEMR